MLFNRYKQSIWWSAYEGEQPVRDAKGNRTGEKAPSYKAPVELRTHVSPARGTAEAEMFGINVPYDRTFILDAKTAPDIKEQDVLYVDTPPDLNDGTVPYDHVIRRIAKSKNYIVCAIEKVRT